MHMHVMKVAVVAMVGLVGVASGQAMGDDGGAAGGGEATKVPFKVGYHVRGKGIPDK